MTLNRNKPGRTVWNKSCFREENERKHNRRYSNLILYNSPLVYTSKKVSVFCNTSCVTFQTAWRPKESRAMSCLKLCPSIKKLCQSSVIRCTTRSSPTIKSSLTASLNAPCLKIVSSQIPLSDMTCSSKFNTLN